MFKTLMVFSEDLMDTQNESFDVSFHETLKDCIQNKIAILILSWNHSDFTSLWSQNEFYRELPMDLCPLSSYQDSLDEASKYVSDFLISHHYEANDCLLLGTHYSDLSIARVLGIPSIGYLNPQVHNENLSPAKLLVEGFDEIDALFLKQTYLHAKFLPIEIAVTDRLIIRELSVDDAPLLYELYQDSAFCDCVTPFADSVTETREKLDAYMKHMYCFYGFGLWGVFLRSSNELIGHCGLEYKEIETMDGDSQAYPELCYAIKSSYWKQGYGAEACNAILKYAYEYLGFQEIITVIDPNNQISLNLSNSLGFKRTSVIIREDPITHQILRYQLSILALDA